MEWQAEVFKVLGSAFVGFFAGRFQTSYNDKIARNKDVQSELLKAIRACSAAAIDYHSGALPSDQVHVKAFHLKSQLWRIRSDLLLTECACSVKKGSLLHTYIEFFDAVTEYPFEASELDRAIDKGRLVRITTSSEKLAGSIATARPRLF